MKEIRLKWLLIGSLLSSIGMSFIWPLTTIYLNDDLHISLTTIGFALLGNSLASVLGSFLGGRLFDRSDPYRLTIAGVSLTFLTLVAMIFWHGWPLYGLWLTLLGLGSGWNITMVNALGTRIRARDGRYVFTMLYFAQNLGVVLGTALVGFVYAHGIALLFMIAAVLYAMFLVVVVLRFKTSAPQATRTNEPDAPHTVTAIPTANRWMMGILFFSLFIVWIMYQQWSSNLSVYMLHLGIPLQQYSFLWTLNAALIVLIQLVLNALIAHRERFSVLGQTLFGFSFVALSFVVLIAARTYPWFVLAMTALTIGEATAFPAIPTIVNNLTPDDQKGKYQGMVNVWASSGRAFGPLFGGLVIELSAYRTLFVIAAIAVMMLAVLIWLVWARTKHAIERFR